MKIKLLALILITLVGLSACQKQEATSAKTEVKKEDAVAVVNGSYISKVSLDTLKQEISQRMRGQSFPEDQLIEELVQREILLQEAVKNNLDQNPEIVARLETLKQSLLSQAVIQDYIKNNAVTDAELKAEYDKQNTPDGSQEYKARHILLKTEAEAKDVIIKLDKGGDFIELAKEVSTGPSGPNGGDLGWFSSTQMVAPFSEAVIAMEDGKYSSEPVQTNFGWHVILREQSRQQPVPEFEAVKAKMLPMLQRQKVQDYVAGLRKQATVEIIKPETVPVATTVNTLGLETLEATPIPVESVEHGHSHAKSADAIVQTTTAEPAAEAVVVEEIEVTEEK